MYEVTNTLVTGYGYSLLIVYKKQYLNLQFIGRIYCIPEAASSTPQCLKTQVLTSLSQSTHSHLKLGTSAQFQSFCGGQNHRNGVFITGLKSSILLTGLETGLSMPRRTDDGFDTVTIKMEQSSHQNTQSLPPCITMD